MNDFDSILQRLRDAMPKDISTIEGSFCGDILAAAANELAKFYAIDIATIYEKAFVSTATGDWLDHACADWGITRETRNGETESDDALRARALAKLKNQSASGNVANYKEWALATDCITAVQVDPLVRGAGTVNLYILPKPPTNPNAVTAVQTYVEKQMPIGASLRVVPFSARTTACSVTIRMETGVDTVAMTELVKQTLTAHFEKLTLSCEKIYISHNAILMLLWQLPGVLDVTNLTIGNNKTSYSFNIGEYPVLDTVNITRQN